MARSSAAGLKDHARRAMRVLVVCADVQRARTRILLPVIRSALPDAHILVVDDDSPDGTGGVVEKVAAELGQITLLHRPGKQGLGSAYRPDGFDYGLHHGYDVVASMDVDLSHDPEVLPELLRMIEAGADAVIGSRYVPGGRADGRLAASPACSRAGGTATRRSCCGCRCATAPRDTARYRASALKEIILARRRPRDTRFPHRARSSPRARQPARCRDTDCLPGSSLRHVEDVRPHRRRVDVVGDDMGRTRRVPAQRLGSPARC